MGCHEPHSRLRIKYLPMETHFKVYCLSFRRGNFSGNYGLEKVCCGGTYFCC